MGDQGVECRRSRVRREKIPIRRVCKNAETDPDIFQIVDARNSLCPCAHFHRGGNEQRKKNANDRENNDQLEQRKGAANVMDAEHTR